MLATKAFTICRDHQVRKLADQNERLRLANTAMQRPYNILTRIHVGIKKRDGGRGTLVNQFDVTEGSFDAAKLVYNFRAPADVEEEEEGGGGVVASLPYDRRIKTIQFFMSGVPVASDLLSIDTKPDFRVCPADEQTEKTVLITAQYSESITFTGKIRGFRGTLDEVKNMIDSGRVNLEWEVWRTGFPPIPNRDTSLDDATLTIDQVSIKKTALQPILDILKMEEPAGGGLLESEELLRSKDEEDGTINVLETLAQVTASRAGLDRVVDERKKLDCRRMMLGASRDLLQTVDASWPDGGLIRCKLEDGRMMKNGSGVDSWTLNGPHLQKQWSFQPIPLKALTKLRFKRANVPISCEGGPMLVAQPQIFTVAGRSVMILKYSDTVSAAFEFDDTFRNANPPVGLRHYVLGQFLGGEGAVTVYDTPGIDLDVKVTLLFIELKLASIQNHLDILGIKTNKAKGKKSKKTTKKETQDA